jgi:hypothetical protein
LAEAVGRRWTSRRGVLVQRQVAAIAVVVCDEVGREPAQMGFVENDHMGEQF